MGMIRQPIPRTSVFANWFEYQTPEKLLWLKTLGVNCARDAGVPVDWFSLGVRLYADPDKDGFVLSCWKGVTREQMRRLWFLVSRHVKVDFMVHEVFGEIHDTRELRNAIKRDVCEIKHGKNV